jgi:hypothetical protein
MPKPSHWVLLAAGLATASAPALASAPDEPFRELPLLTWQQEAELSSTVRQVLMNTYLPFLARPTDFRGVHNDAIPNQVDDWNWHRSEVQAQLRGRQDDVDARRRSHGALPDAEINALIGKKQAFRPEQLEQILTGSPRFDDIIVTVRRVQPLGPTASGGEVYRVDFDVKTLSGGVSETTSFDRVDIVNNLGTWLLPTRLILDVAPIARAGAALAGNASPLDLARSAIAVVLATARDISPIAIPRLPIIE